MSCHSSFRRQSIHIRWVSLVMCSAITCSYAVTSVNSVSLRLLLVVQYRFEAFGESRGAPRTSRRRDPRWRSRSTKMVCCGRPGYIKVARGGESVASIDSTNAAVTVWETDRGPTHPWFCPRSMLLSNPVSLACSSRIDVSCLSTVCRLHKAEDTRR